MPKTALEMPREEWRQYRPGQRQTFSGERWKRAWTLAQDVARVLKEKFGATRVVVFGSVARREALSPWSDIDIAAWGIPKEKFYQAVAYVTGLSPDFKIDLIDPAMCRPSLRAQIEEEGIEL